MGKLLRNLERARDGRCLIVAAQSHDRRNIAAGLSRGRLGAGVRLPLAGEAGVQVVHIRLLFSGLTVIHQRHAEVKILRFVSGQLAVGNSTVPLQLHAGVVLLHEQHARANASLYKNAVFDTNRKSLLRHIRLKKA